MNFNPKIQPLHCSMFSKYFNCLNMISTENDSLSFLTMGFGRVPLTYDRDGT